MFAIGHTFFFFKEIWPAGLWYECPYSDEDEDPAMGKKVLPYLRTVWVS